ncbi:hypothetical protein H5410_054828 [Solanum commersonii]|uniref:Uncharacterized protein n=1 Tax=Solanum commersonii TaxID=4109 RepID=A0A9J5WIK9_SOLCO|nr:hypothetical protein H5410_054828 [Solanum commersonii]
MHTKSIRNVLFLSLNGSFEDSQNFEKLESNSSFKRNPFWGNGVFLRRLPNFIIIVQSPHWSDETQNRSVECAEITSGNIEF